MSFFHTEGIFPTKFVFHLIELCHFFGSKLFMYTYQKDVVVYHCFLGDCHAPSSKELVLYYITKFISPLPIQSTMHLFSRQLPSEQPGPSFSTNVIWIK